MASEDLLKKAVAAFNALSPEQQAEMLEEQRQSWVRGNIGLSRDERGMTSPVMPQPTTVMVSELKPWRYEIKYGPDGEDAYSWVYDDHGAMVATMKTHKAKQIVDAMNTPVAPVSPDATGKCGELVTPELRQEIFELAKDLFWRVDGNQRLWSGEEREIYGLQAAMRIARSQAVKLLAAKDKKISELEALLFSATDVEPGEHQEILDALEAHNSGEEQ